MANCRIIHINSLLLSSDYACKDKRHFSPFRKKYVSKAFFALHINDLLRDQVQWAKSWRSSRYSSEFGFLKLLGESEITEMQNVEFKDTKSRTDWPPPSPPYAAPFAWRERKEWGWPWGETNLKWIQLLFLWVPLPAQVAGRITNPRQCEHKEKLEDGNEMRHPGSPPAVRQMQDEHQPVANT